MSEPCFKIVIIFQNIFLTLKCILNKKIKIQVNIKVLWPSYIKQNTHISLFTFLEHRNNHES